MINQKMMDGMKDVKTMAGGQYQIKF